MKFKLMAQRRKNYDPVALYQSAVSKRDPLTGLLSESGFYEEALKEVERFKRYHNPLSLIAFQVHCEDNTREIPCLCQCASIIKASSRMTDIIARFGNNQIICLLAETTESQAMLAAQKFISNIRSGQVESFALNAGIIQYTGASAIEDTVFAACSDASRNGNTIWINQQENILSYEQK
jgi:PleD family two-component response regulator